MLTVQNETDYFASSEGSRVVTPHLQARLVVFAVTRADDGMDLFRDQTFEAETLDGLPSQSEMESAIRALGKSLEALRKAPVTEPFDGPAILSGRASAVFFHEVLGHRLEGQRQRGDEEGQTFTKELGKDILPSFLSVADDPTRTIFDKTWLSGSYTYDDEGQKAQRVELIQDGVLKTFLMSRLPIASFSESNGHGRAQTGRMPTGRQGNLIVTSTKSVPDSELRKQLIEEAKKQGKPYGLYFEDISSGFAVTQRSSPQAFQVIPLVVYRVYVDGRPDELVRGVEHRRHTPRGHEAHPRHRRQARSLQRRVRRRVRHSPRQRRRPRHARQRNRNPAPTTRHRAPTHPSHPRRARREGGSMTFTSVRHPENPRARGPMRNDSCSWGKRSEGSAFALNEASTTTIPGTPSWTRFLRQKWVATILAFLLCTPIAAQSTRVDAEKDPILAAMLTELDRSTSQLQLPGFQRPFFIQYRIEDVDDFETKAAFGATEGAGRNHARVARVTVLDWRLQDRQLRRPWRRRRRNDFSRRRSHRAAFFALGRHRSSLQKCPRRLRAKTGRSQAGADAAPGRRLQSPASVDLPADSAITHPRRSCLEESRRSPQRPLPHRRFVEAHRTRCAILLRHVSRPRHHLAPGQ